MKNLNKKGFTLIELLAVIVIMGILMFVAIPAVSRTIENSRKDTFVNTAKQYANQVKTLWASDGLECGSSNTLPSAISSGTYTVKIDSSSTDPDEMLLDEGGKSSWGNKDVSGNVVITFNSNGKPQYSVTLSDGTKGIEYSSGVLSDSLDRASVVDLASATSISGAVSCTQR